MIKINKFNGLKPSVAYTDFTAIYISKSLSNKEVITALKHERAHIFLQHNIRMKPLLNKKLANIAADLEIAYHIYNDDDTKTIKTPRSLLSGGILKEDCKKYPNCIYMEDFYEELLKQPNNSLQSFDGDSNIEDNKTNEEIKKPIADIIKDAIKSVKECHDLDEKQDNIHQIQQRLKEFKAPKPSLASELMATFGRNKLKHKRSYRNPDEFEENQDFFKKGWIAEKRKPKLNIFVDRSGSFDDAKTAQATQMLDKCLMKYRGRINKDVFYFNHQLMNQDPKQGSGGTNYELIINKINDDAADMSVIITDDDPCCSKVGPKFKVVVIPVGCMQTNIGKMFNLIEVEDCE